MDATFSSPFRGLPERFGDDVFRDLSEYIL